MSRRPRGVSASPTGGLIAAAINGVQCFARDMHGSTMILFALVVPMLMALTGLAVDQVMLYRFHTNAQASADAAALAGAKELSLADIKKDNVQLRVQSVAEAYIASNFVDTKTAYKVLTQIIEQADAPLQVGVEIQARAIAMFGDKIGLGDHDVNVKAVAVVVGKPNICVLALDDSATGTIFLEKEAKIIGQDCAVYSNSVHPNGIKAFNSSMLQASLICSAGGKAGGKGNFSPEPLIDCPQFADPLANRPEPDVASCLETDLVIQDALTTLRPGTYCGGLAILGKSEVTLEPGVYVFQDGPLLVGDQSSFKGDGVGLFLTGDQAAFTFETGTTISLTAPTTGPMAGILMFGARSQTGLRHQILSDNARQLLGTIYLPTGELSIDANEPIADQSAYTAVVVKKLTGNSGPIIYLNTNYDSTDVPVPDGIRFVGQNVRLYR